MRYRKEVFDLQTTDITTKDSDINVIYGTGLDGYETREEAFHSVKYLYTDITDIRKYYIRLGFHLNEFNHFEYYRDFGYLTLEEFCINNLGLDKGAVSRCINVFREFNAADDVTYKNGIKFVGCAMDLSERWKDYSYTQLCEMLPLSEDERKEVRPDMTVRQIRDYKKKLREDKDVAASIQRNLFDFKKYDSVQGIVRQNLVKNCSPLNDNAVCCIFDRDGKLIHGGVACDLFGIKDGRYYFRLWDCEE